MIHADLQHHADQAEDKFTSNCLGLLRLLPDRDFINFFSTAMKLDKTRIDLSHHERVSKIDFWPWLPSAGFPDVIPQLQHEDGTTSTLIIEAKLGAPKSGTAGTPGIAETSESTDLTQDDRVTVDQLAKYWQAGYQHFRRPAVIYLTHHDQMPEKDIKESLSKAGADAGIFWLSWFDLNRWASDQLDMMEGDLTTDARILETLRDYLGAKGFRCFLGWPPFPRSTLVG